MEYVSVQEKWANGKGMRNTVTIRNRGAATKTVEVIGKRGQTLKKKTRKLTAKEKRAILANKFVPGLWKNCRFGGKC